MKHFKRLSTEDAERYFHGTIAVHNETGKAFIVTVAGGPTYVLDSLENYRQEYTNHRPAEFFDEYTISKFPIGWANFVHGDHRLARYMHTTPGRRMRKGYSVRDIEYFDPYAESLRGAHHRIVRNAEPPDDPYSKMREEVRDQLARIEAHLTAISRAGRGALLYNVAGSAAHPDFWTVDDVLENFSGTPSRSGMAMSLGFAAVVDRHYTPEYTSLYHHTKRVGWVGDDVHLDEAYKHLAPEFIRTLNHEPQIGA